MSNPTDSPSSVPSEREKLEKLVASDALDLLLQVIGSKAWIVLWCCFSLLIIGISWSLLGAIPVKVQGTGISMTESGPFIVVAQIEGTVINTCVSSGEFVEKGDLLVELENPGLAFDIEHKKSSLVSKEADLQALMQRIEAEKAARNATIIKEIETTVFSLKTAESNIAFLQKDLESKQRLEKMGIIPQHTVEDAKNKLEQTKIDIESYRATMVRLKADLSKSYRVEELQAKISEVGGTRTDLARMTFESQNLEVRAGRSGKVLELVVANGDRIVPGMEIASVEVPITKGEHLRYYACFPAQYGDLLDVDLPVEIAVSGVDPKQYGFLLGKTKFVSPYPVTSQELKSDVRNAEIAQFLRGGDEVVYSAIIELQVDPTTKSGYAWSSKSGPPWQLSSGTIGTIQTIVDRKPPIIYILPVDFSPTLYKLLSKRETVGQIERINEKWQ